MHGVDRRARTLFFWGHTTCIPSGNSFNRGESPASARCHESLNKNPELTIPFFPSFGCIKHTKYRDVQSPPKVQHTRYTRRGPGLGWHCVWLKILWKGITQAQLQSRGTLGLNRCVYTSAADVASAEAFLSDDAGPIETIPRYGTSVRPEFSSVTLKCISTA